MLNYELLYAKYSNLDIENVEELNISSQEKEFFFSYAQDIIHNDSIPSVTIQLHFHKDFGFKVYYYSTTLSLYIFFQNLLHIKKDFVIKAILSSGSYIITNYSPFPDFFFSEKSIKLDYDFVYNKDQTFLNTNITHAQKIYECFQSLFLGNIPKIKSCFEDTILSLQCFSCVVASSSPENIIVDFEEFYKSHIFSPCFSLRKFLGELPDVSKDLVLSIFYKSLVSPNNCYADYYCKNLFGFIDTDLGKYLDDVMKSADLSHDSMPNKINHVYNAFIRKIYSTRYTINDEQYEKLFRHVFAFPNTPIQNSQPVLFSQKTRLYAIIILLTQNESRFFSLLHSIPFPINLSNESMDAFCPSGLRNYGHTCYFNSLVQCLSICPCFYKCLESNINNDFVQILLKLLVDVSFGKNSRLYYDDINDINEKIVKNFANSNGSVDLCEYLRHFLENLGDERFSDIFRIQFLYTDKLLTQNSEQERTDSDLIFNLYCNDHTKSFYDLINDMENQYINDSFERSVSIVSVSDVLLIRINSAELNNQILMFPDCYKDRTLYAVVAYSGEGPGHYIAIVRKSKFWYVCNDSNIQMIGNQYIFSYIQAISMSPYILFYQKEPSFFDSSSVGKLASMITESALSTWGSLMFREVECRKIRKITDEKIFISYLSYYFILRSTITINTLHDSIIDIYSNEPMFHQNILKRLAEQSEKTLDHIFSRQHSELLMNYIKEIWPQIENIDISYKQRLRRKLVKYDFIKELEEIQNEQETSHENSEEDISIQLLDKLAQFEQYIARCLYDTEFNYTKEEFNTLANYINSMQNKKYVYDLLFNFANNVKYHKFGCLAQMLIDFCEMNGPPSNYSTNNTKFLAFIYKSYNKEPFFMNYNKTIELSSYNLHEPTEIESLICIGYFPDDFVVSYNYYTSNYLNPLHCACCCDNLEAYKKLVDYYTLPCDLKTLLIENGSLNILEYVYATPEWTTDLIMVAITHSTIGFFLSSIPEKKLLKPEIFKFAVKHHCSILLNKYYTKINDTIRTHVFEPGEVSIAQLIQFNYCPGIAKLFITKQKNDQIFFKVCLPDLLNSYHDVVVKHSERLENIGMLLKMLVTTVYANIKKEDIITDLDAVLYEYCYYASYGDAQLNVELFAMYLQANNIIDNGKSLSICDILYECCINSQILSKAYQSKVFIIQYVFRNRRSTFQILEEKEQKQYLFTSFDDPNNLSLNEYLMPYPDYANKFVGYLKKETYVTQYGLYLLVTPHKQNEIVPDNQGKYFFFNIKYTCVFAFGINKDKEEQLNLIEYKNKKWRCFSSLPEVYINYDRYDDLLLNTRIVLLIFKRETESIPKISIKYIKEGTKLNFENDFDRIAYNILIKMWPFIDMPESQWIDMLDTEISDAGNLQAIDKLLTIIYDWAVKKRQFNPENIESCLCKQVSLDSTNQSKPNEAKKYDIHESHYIYPKMLKMNLTPNCPKEKLELCPLFVQPSAYYQIIQPIENSIIIEPTQDNTFMLHTPMSKIDQKIPQSIITLMQASGEQRFEQTRFWIPPSKNRRIVPNSTVWHFIPPHSKWLVLLPYDIIFYANDALLYVNKENIVTWSANSLAQLMNMNEIKKIDITTICDIQNDNIKQVKLGKKASIEYARQQKTIKLLQHDVELLTHKSTEMIRTLYDNEVLNMIIKYAIKYNFSLCKQTIRYTKDEIHFWIELFFKNHNAAAFLTKSKLGPSRSTIHKWIEDFKPTIPLSDFTNINNIGNVIEYWEKTFNIQHMNAVIGIDAMHVTRRIEIDKEGNARGLTKNVQFTRIEMEQIKRLKLFAKIVDDIIKNGLAAHAVFVVLIIPIGCQKPLPVHYILSEKGNASQNESDCLEKIIKYVNNNHPNITLFGRSHDADPQYIDAQDNFYLPTTKLLTENNFSLVTVTQLTQKNSLISADIPHILKRLRNRSTKSAIAKSYTGENIDLTILKTLVNELEIPSKATTNKKNEKMVDENARNLFSPIILINIIEKQQKLLSEIMIPGTLLRIVFYNDELKRKDRLFLLAICVHYTYLVHCIYVNKNLPKQAMIMTYNQLIDMFNSAFQFIMILQEVPNAFCTSRTGSTECEHFFSGVRRIASGNDNGASVNTILNKIIMSIAVNPDFNCDLIEGVKRPAIIEEGIEKLSVEQDQTARRIAVSLILWNYIDGKNYLPTFYTDNITNEIIQTSVNEFLSVIKLWKDEENPNSSLFETTNNSVTDEKDSQARIFGRIIETPLSAMYEKASQNEIKEKDLHKIVKNRVDEAESQNTF